jgi:tetratricopeptide (TPR) repeat protein
MRRPLWLALLTATAFCSVSSMPSTASASSADELYASGKRAEASHDDDVAARRYSEALALDGSLAEAWMALGALRTRQGDHREAERVYAVFVSRVPSSVAGHLAHAEALHTLGRTEDAAAEIEIVARVAPRERKRLGAWYAEDGLYPAALATWRAVLAQAVSEGDDETSTEARAMVRALVLFAKPCDPAAFPASDDRYRRLLGKIARSGGI